MQFRMKKAILFLLIQLCSLSLVAQINTDRVLAIGRNALYFEDYVLSIQYFNQVIRSKPWLAEPYFYRAIAKVNLDDFKGAEEDCTLCLERNPFLVQAYYCRVLQGKVRIITKVPLPIIQKDLSLSPKTVRCLLTRRLQIFR